MNPLNTAHTSSDRLAWYQQARFGLFIHWGAYAAAGVEASWPIMAPEISAAMFGAQTRISQDAYIALPARFNPSAFDPAEWVRIAQQAGMRYIVITAKHHDGFCLFDAPGTDYKITRTPYGQDVCLELARACADAGMPLGFYYSPPDMHHPGYRDISKPVTRNWLGEPRRPAWAGYLDYMESHLRKLLTDYGKVSLIWFDGLVNHAKYNPPRFHRLIHDLSPATLINDRLGDGYDFITPEQFIPAAGIPVRTGQPPAANGPAGERFFRIVINLFRIPGLRALLGRQIRKYSEGGLELSPLPRLPYPSPHEFQPWETCMTIGKSWAYNPYETQWKPAGQLVRNLVEVVSRGGNYLLDVGPTDLGTFPPKALARLQAIGRWMEANHEAIYGASYTPLRNLPWGRATRKGDRLYLFIFRWPAGRLLEIQDFPGRARAVKVLNGEALEFNLQQAALHIRLPQQAPDPEVSVLALDIESSDPGWRNYSVSHPKKS